MRKVEISEWVWKQSRGVSKCLIENSFFILWSTESRGDGVSFQICKYYIWSEPPLYMGPHLWGNYGFLSTATSLYSATRVQLRAFFVFRWILYSGWACSRGRSSKTEFMVSVLCKRPEGTAVKCRNTAEPPMNKGGTQKDVAYLTTAEKEK